MCDLETSTARLQTFTRIM